MRRSAIFILSFFILMPLVFGFAGQTKMRIDEIYNNTASRILLSPTNYVEINSDAKFTGTGAIKLPVGDISERPTPEVGMLRYNSEEESFEGYDGSEWGAIGGAGGGGGSAGINFVPDSSFEKNELLLDVDENGTGSYQTFDDNNKLDSEFNSFYFRSVWQGVTNNDTFIKDTFARTDLDGKQGLFSIWVKANADNFELCLRTDDPNFESACEDAYKLNVIGDNTWRKYEIPFIYGASSVQYDVRNSDYTGSATIEIDNIYIGTMPDGYISKIDTTITDWESFTPGFGGVSLGTGFYQYGYKRRVGDNLEVKAGFRLGTGGSLVGNLGMIIPDGLVIDTSKLGDFPFKISGEGIIHDAGNDIFNTKVFITNPTNVSLKYLADQQASTANPITSLPDVNATQPMVWVAGDEINFSFTAPIVGWSTDYSTVVSQNTELTAKTANEFSARISSSGVVLSENYDWINGNCVYDSVDGSYGCTLNNLNITNPLACTIGESFTNRNVVYSRTTSTTNLVRFVARLSTTDTVSSADFDVHCSKQGADVNKSATIVGKFEQISKEVIRPNYIINGNFDFWQRGASASLSTSTYLADRWLNGFLNNNSANISRQTFANIAGEPPGSKYFHRFEYPSSTNNSNERVNVLQRIEDVTRLAGKTVTVSMWVKANANKFIAIEIQQIFGISPAINGSGSKKFAIGTTWQKITHTISIPSVEGKSIGDTNYTGLIIWLSAGSDINDRTDSLGNQSGTFDIAQVKLEEGDTATPFVLAGGTIEGELAACQRYYEQSSFGAIGAQAQGYVYIAPFNIINGDAAQFGGSFFRIVKRVIPTVTLYGVDYTGTAPNTINVNGVSRPALAEGVSASGFRRITNTSGVTWNSFSNVAYNWVADAEF